MALIFSRRGTSLWWGFGSAMAASLIGLVWSVRCLLFGLQPAAVWPWTIPFVA